MRKISILIITVLVFVGAYLATVSVPSKAFNEGSTVRAWVWSQDEPSVSESDPANSINFTVYFVIQDKSGSGITFGAQKISVDLSSSNPNTLDNAIVDGVVQFANDNGLNLARNDVFFQKFSRGS